MNVFSSRSQVRKSECHPELQLLADEVIKHYNCSIITGYRNKQDQDKAFRERKSKLKFPQSKHNLIPSRAIDIVPYEDKIDYDERQCLYFSGFVKATSIQLYIQGKMQFKIRSGSDWDDDNDINDTKLFDPCHFELIT